jgi:carbon-monoxide dehydrogenase medium subunit
MYDFNLLTPKTLQAAVMALQREGAQALAGGQTLIPTMKQRLASPDYLVSLTAIEALKGVSLDSGYMVIGAITSHTDVAVKAETGFPALANLAGQIGDPAVRNRGSIGGSLANNDPAACYPAAVLACNAVVETNLRQIAADDYFDGMFGTALGEGEVITAVRFPIPDAANYQKFVQPASRFALVGVFVAQFSGKVRVAVTGASEDGVFRWTEAEKNLSKSFSAEVIDSLAVDPADMIADAHASQEYRAHLVGIMTKRAVSAAGT